MRDRIAAGLSFFLSVLNRTRIWYFTPPFRPVLPRAKIE